MQSCGSVKGSVPRTEEAAVLFKVSVPNTPGVHEENVGSKTGLQSWGLQEGP